MANVKITLSNSDLLNTHCSIAFVKHIDKQRCAPERALNDSLNGQLEALFREAKKPKAFYITTSSPLPFQALCILNFYKEDLPFGYPSLDNYARRMIKVSKEKKVTSIATVLHGPSAGIDAPQAMETLLSSFRREYIRKKGDFGYLREIILVEHDLRAFNQLKEHLAHLLERTTYLTQNNGNFYINPRITKDSLYELRQTIPSEYVFVAMPFNKAFNNIYHYAIKGAIKSRKLICERLDKEHLTGDILERIKERISKSLLVIADTSGNCPNVFYEVGYADASMKDIILISQTADLPFDICTRECIQYDPQDIEPLEHKLGEYIANIQARNSSQQKIAH